MSAFSAHDYLTTVGTTTALYRTSFKEELWTANNSGLVVNISSAVGITTDDQPVPTYIQGFCKSPFWDPSLTNEAQTPNLTPCFKWTVLVWAPSMALMLLGPPYVINVLKKRRAAPIPRSWLNVTKLILSILLIVLNVIRLVRHTSGTQHVVGSSSPAAVVADVISISVMVAAMILSEVDRRYGQRLNSVLAVFWFLSSITAILTLASDVQSQLYQTEKLLFVTQCISTPVVFTQMILSLVLIDRPPRSRLKDSEEKKCPYYEASVLARLTFWWGFRMILEGYRRPLINKDMWELRSEYKSQTNVPPLLNRWLKKLQHMNRSKKHTVEVRADTAIPLKSAQDGIKVQPVPKAVYNPSFFLTIVRTFWVSYAMTVVLKLVQEILMFTSPHMMKLLLGFIRDPTILQWKGYLYAVSMFLLAVCQSIVQQHFNYIYLLTGLKVRAAVMSLIYRKALKLSHAARKESTVGEIVNLMSVDTQRFVELPHFFNMIWAAPVQVAMALYFLWGMLGPAIFAGLGVIIFFIPFNAIIVRINKKLQRKHMEQKDARMKMMNEILNGIKVLKLYAWEESFEKKVLAIRERELHTMRLSIIVHACSTALWVCSPFLVSLASFGAYTRIFPDEPLDAQKIFVSLSFFNLLKGPLEQLPGLIANIVQMNVSLDRIGKYLKHEELDPDSVQHNPDEADAVVVERGNFGWSKESVPLLKDINMRIKEGSLVAVVGVVGAGKSSLLSAILGEMDKCSGRVNMKGSVAYVSQQAWIQQATLQDNVLFHNKLQDKLYKQVIEDCALLPDLEILPAGDQTEIGEKGINLSGGQKLRVSLARAVFHTGDIYILDDPLSAVDAHVGKQIFEHIIGPNGMLRNKTRILVTHGISFLPQVDQIIVLADGCITESGSYLQLLEKNGAFADFLRNYLLTHTDEAADQELTPEETAMRQEMLSHLSGGADDVKSHDSKLNGSADRCSVGHVGVVSSSPPISNGFLKEPGLSHGQEDKSILKNPALTRVLSTGSGSHHQSHHGLSQTTDDLDVRLNKATSLTQSQLLCASQTSLAANDLLFPPDDVEEGEVTYSHTDKKPEKQQPDFGRLVDEETAEIGNVKLSVYSTYLRAIGLPISLFVMSLAASHVAFSMASNVWLSQWSDDVLLTEKDNYTDSENENRTIGFNNGSDSTFAPETSSKAPWIPSNNYRLAVYAVLGIMQGIMAAMQELCGLIASMRTSRIQHEHLLRNILSCPMSFFDQTPIGRILNRFGKDVEVMDSVLPRFFLPLMRWISHLIGSMIIIAYVTPYSLIAWATLSVLYVIVQRLYVSAQRQLNRLMSINRSPIYAHFSETLTGASTIRAYRREETFMQESMQRINKLNMAWYPAIVNNRVLGIVLESMGAIIVLVAATFAVAGRNTLTPGTVGLAITYALTITWTFNWIVRFTGQVETQIVSVERIKEYTEVTTEPPRVIPDNRPPDAWPEEGTVKFDSYSLRYRPGLDLVLHGITCHFKPSEKIGIVGRTGAGKSSLTMALFRIVEAAEGAIFIDGVNISEIGLHDLRSKLTIIPQDPVLFSGSLRMNLDPFDAHTDDEIWTALTHAHLHSFVSGLPDQLKHDCAEGGENLSVGQRQLICLARALLRKTRILILDEATAAVDLETDDLIQSTIRTEFADCTVLTIAHRLNTIIDCTKVLVLEAGKVKELDSPQNLLADRSTIFYSMAKDAGLAD